MVKNPPANTGDTGSIPDVGRPRMQQSTLTIHRNYRAHAPKAWAPQRRVAPSHCTRESACTAKKTQCSKVNQQLKKKITSSWILRAKREWQQWGWSFEWGDDGSLGKSHLLEDLEAGVRQRKDGCVFRRRREMEQWVMAGSRWMGGRMETSVSQPAVTVLVTSPPHPSTTAPYLLTIFLYFLK